MPIWILAKKELRLLLRDPWSAILLVVMPLLFILVLGLLLGEGFGQKSDDRTRVLIVNLDEGVGENEVTLPGKKGGKWADEIFEDMKDTAGLRVETMKDPEEARRLVEEHKLPAVLILNKDFSRRINSCGFLTEDRNPFHRDGILLDTIDAELIKDDKQTGQAAIIEQVAQVTLLRVILPYMIGKAFRKLGEPGFIQLLGDQVFLPVPQRFPFNYLREFVVSRAAGYRVTETALEALKNEKVPQDVLKKLEPLKGEPFADEKSFKEALNLTEQDERQYLAKILSRCPKENFKKEYKVTAAALKTLTEPAFIRGLPEPPLAEELIVRLKQVQDKEFATPRSFLEALALAPDADKQPQKRILAACLEETVNLNELLRIVADRKPDQPPGAKEKDYQERVGIGVQRAVNFQFKKYELTGMTWEKLTRSRGERLGAGGVIEQHQDAGGSGVLKRGAYRYQLLVPAYTVMFSFFLVLMVGWIFVSERRQGTLKRLRLAPITRGEILIGKLIPCLLISLGQGALLLLAGKLLFGMRWGPERWPLAEQILWLLPVVCSTSLAAMGLAMLVAALARTEMQVALFGAIPVLVLALIGGCILPREMMPDQTQAITLLTPHGWSLQAYSELLDPNPQSNPQIGIVLRSCGVLAAFGVVTVGIAWRALRLD